MAPAQKIPVTSGFLEILRSFQTTVTLSSLASITCFDHDVQSYPKGNTSLLEPVPLTRRFYVGRLFCCFQDLAVSEPWFWRQSFPVPVILSMSWILCDRHIPPTPENPGPQQGKDPTIQNCSCAQCSDVQRTQAGPPTWYPIEQQDPRHFGDAVANQDQNVDNRAETAMIVPNRAWAQFRGIPLQTARVQNNFGYPPVHQSVGPPNMELSQAPTLDASIAESRRRLAGRYLNNPDAYVSTIRLEPGPSGQFQVIITLEMIDIV